MDGRPGENCGLCSTCDNAPTCMHVGDAERPVMFCEEFTQDGAAKTGVRGQGLGDRSSETPRDGE